MYLDLLQAMVMLDFLTFLLHNSLVYIAMFLMSTIHDFISWFLMLAFIFQSSYQFLLEPSHDLQFCPMKPALEDHPAPLFTCQFVMPTISQHIQKGLV